MKRSLLRSLGLALLAVAAGACGMADPDIPNGPCNNNTDCAQGEVCYEDGCGSALEFAVRVTPLKDSGLTVQDFNSASVAKASLELALKEPAKLAGDVLVKRDTAVELYDATEQDPRTAFVVQARGRSSSIPGLAFPQAVAQTVKNGSGYSLMVPAGIWDISVTPADPTLPPVYAHKSVAPAAAADPGLMLVAGANLSRVEGFVVRDASLAWPAIAPSFRIQALEPEKGTPLSQPWTFGASELFQLNTLKVSAMVLRVTPDPASPVPAPSKDFESNPDGTFSLPLVLGDFGEPVEITGKVASPSGAPIENAEIRVEGRVRGGGVFTANARTRTQGEFSLKLLPTAPATGTEPATRYSLTAIPPQTSPFASTTVTAEVSEARALDTIVCGHKVALSGTVFGPDSAPLADVVVHYEGNPSALDPGLSKGDIKTDAQGGFSVQVEPGAYRLVAKPRSEQRLPWTARRVHTSEAPATLMVSAAREVPGAVIDWQGAPVGNAIVTFYRRPASGAGDDAPAPAVVFEVLSDSSGRFRAIVPKAPEPAE